MLLVFLTGIDTLRTSFRLQHVLSTRKNYNICFTAGSFWCINSASHGSRNRREDLWIWNFVQVHLFSFDERHADAVLRHVHVWRGSEDERWWWYLSFGPPFQRRRVHETFVHIFRSFLCRPMNPCTNTVTHKQTRRTCTSVYLASRICVAQKC